MLDLFNLPLFVLASGFLGFVINTIASRIQDVRKRKAWGCEPIPKKFQWDPIFGFDMVWSQWKALRGHYFVPWLNELHVGMPRTFSIRFLGRKQICTIDPENLKVMTAIHWKDFGISPLRRYPGLGGEFADKGVNTVDGEDWVFSRSLIKPFFMREVYADIDRITPYTDQLLSLLPPDGETMNLQPLLQRWFLDVTTHFIFGAPMEALTYPERAKVTWAMLDVLRGARLRLQLYRIFYLIDWSWWDKAVKVVNRFMQVRIDKVYADITEHKLKEESGEDTGPPRYDLLWYMANHCPDQKELHSQLSLLFVPNNDTTSIFTSNVIWHLARNPSSWEKVRREVLDHGDAPITFETLRGMKYIQACLNETHRLNPNNVTQVRSCLKDTTLPRGGGKDGKSPIFIRKGDIVQVTKTALQKDPEYFGEDADVFRPERFLETTHFWDFVPFSGGPRRCPAQMMVGTEAAYLILRLAQIYKRIEPRDANPFTAVMRIGPSNKTGVMVAFHKD